jgi:hypothetical protein
MVLLRWRWPWQWRDGATESCWWWRYHVDIGHGMLAILLLSLASDGALEVTLGMASCHCGVMMAMAQLRLASDGAAEATLAVVWCYCRVVLVMALPSLASDGAVKETLVVAWCCCRVILAMALLSLASNGPVEAMLAMAWSHYRVMLAMALSSLADDGAAKSCWWWRCRGDVGHGVMSLLNHVGDRSKRYISCAGQDYGRAIYQWSHHNWLTYTQSSCAYVCDSMEGGRLCTHRKN